MSVVYFVHEEEIFKGKIYIDFFLEIYLIKYGLST